MIIRRIYFTYNKNFTSDGPEDLNTKTFEIDGACFLSCGRDDLHKIISQSTVYTMLNYIFFPIFCPNFFPL